MNREAIYSAVYDLATGGPVMTAALKTKGRKLKHWSDVPLTAQPALFQAQKRETPKQQTGLPAVWMLELDLYLYVSTKGAASPGEVLNPLLDAITDKFDATAIAPQTLGGLVQWARIGGTIETSEGTLGDQEVAIIPIHILTL